MTIGNNIFYFPAAKIWRRLTKNTIILKIPKKNTGRDFLRASEEFRVTGTWRDDDIEKLYDSKTAITRYVNIRLLAKQGRVGSNIGLRGYLKWGAYTYTVYIKEFKGINTPGYGTDIEYNAVFIREVLK